MSNMVVGGVDIGDVLEGFGAVQAFGAGRYIEPGKYLFKISSLEFKKGFKGVTAIGTNEVVHIEHTEDGDLAVGGERNLVEPMSGANAAIGKSNLKGYLLAACESLYQQKIDPKGVNEAFVVPLAGPSQPLKGVYVWCEAFKKEKQKKPGEFITVKNWRMATNAELAGLGFVQPAPRS